MKYNWEHSRNRFGLLRWFCFYFCFTAVTSQSHTFKVVHLKHSLLTLMYHSRYESTLSVSTLSFSLPYTLVFGLPYFIDTLRIQSLSLRKLTGLHLSSVLPLIPISDHFLCFWAQRRILSTLRLSGLLWMKNVKKLKQTLTFSPKWFVNKVKSLYSF